MKIIPQKILSQGAKVDKNAVNAVLIYGQNNGLCVEVLRRVISDVKKEGDVVININAAEIEKNPEILLDEILNPSLFGESKVVVVSQATTKIGTVVESVFSSPNFSVQNAFLVIHAMELDAGVKLRTMFENAENLYCVACYHDDAASLKGVVVDFFNARGIKYESSLVSEIIDNFNGERGLLVNELEKFDLFLGERRSFIEEDLVAVFFDEKEVSLTEFVDFFCLGNKKMALERLEKLIGDDFNGVMIIRSIILHLISIREVLVAVMAGGLIDNIMKEKRFFFKRVPMIKRQVGMIRVEDVDILLQKALVAELQIKMNSSTDGFDLYCLKKLTLLR